ncbi:hypothetical protein EON67_11095 [archaeon]|nr:MAG: hypothetical protein EON67_11095 [archaeon]
MITYSIHKDRRSVTSMGVVWGAKVLVNTTEWPGMMGNLFNTTVCVSPRRVTTAASSTLANASRRGRGTAVAVPDTMKGASARCLASTGGGTIVVNKNCTRARVCREQRPPRNTCERARERTAQ